MTSHVTPLWDRLRDLLARHPEGPLPDEEIEAIRRGTGIGPEVIDLDAWDDDDFEDFALDDSASDDLDIDPEAELEAELRDAVLRALGAAADTADLRHLTVTLRKLQGDQRFHYTPTPDLTDLALPPHRARTIALHLLDTGTTRIELKIGLRLLAMEVREEDVERVRDLVLLGSGFRSEAVAVIGRAADAAAHLYRLIERSAPDDREGLLLDFLDIDFDLLAALPSAAPIGIGSDLVLELGAFEFRPEAMHEDRRFAAPFLDAAEHAVDLTRDAESLALLVRLHDGLAYGIGALLRFAPGERPLAVERFRSALASAGAAATAAAALEARPDDPDALWLVRQTRRAARAEPETFPPGLAVRITVPAPSSGFDVRANVLVDGLSLAERHLANGGPTPPETVLRTGGGLKAGAEPKAALLGNPGCGGPGCCESLIADIRLDAAAGEVEWSVRFTEFAGPATYRFDADAYAAEIERAAADLDWEWPARRAARLLRERLEAEPELLARWECELDWTSSSIWDTGRVQMVFGHPRVPAPLEFEAERVQFRLEFEVPDALDMDDDAILAAVEGVLADLRSKDPRSRETWCGGSSDMAERLGYL